MKITDENLVFREIDKTINRKPQLLSEQELDEAIILAAGKRYLHQRHRTLKALFQEQKQALLDGHDREVVKARIDELELIHWLYKENNGQSLDMKFVEVWADRIKALTNKGKGEDNED